MSGARLLLTARSSNSLGMLAMAAGTAAFVGNDTMVKLTGAGLPPGEIMLLRGACASGLLLLAALVAGAFRVKLRDVVVPAQFWRLAGELGSTFTFVIALMHLRLADMSGIQQFQPLAITAGSALFLKEQVGWRRWLAALAGLTGVLLIVKPGTGAFNVYAALALTCVLFVVVRDLGTRSLPPGQPVILLALLSALTVTAGSTALMPFETWTVPDTEQTGMLVLAAVFLVGGYLLIILSVRVGELSAVAPLRYTGVILSVPVQIAIWNVLPDGLAFAGMGLVVAAGLYTFHRERVRANVIGPTPVLGVAR